MMAPALTLHQGGSKREFVEAPQVTLKRAEVAAVRRLVDSLDRRL